VTNLANHIEEEKDKTYSEMLRAHPEDSLTMFQNKETQIKEKRLQITKTAKEVLSQSS
jgi:hypothetical protein